MCRRKISKNMWLVEFNLEIRVCFSSGATLDNVLVVRLSRVRRWVVQGFVQVDFIFKVEV